MISPEVYAAINDKRALVAAKKVAKEARENRNKQKHALVVEEAVEKHAGELPSWTVTQLKSFFQHYKKKEDRNSPNKRDELLI